MSRDGMSPALIDRVDLPWDFGVQQRGSAQFVDACEPADLDVLLSIGTCPPDLRRVGALVEGWEGSLEDILERWAERDRQSLVAKIIPLLGRRPALAGVRGCR